MTLAFLTILMASNNLISASKHQSPKCLWHTMKCWVDSYLSLVLLAQSAHFSLKRRSFGKPKRLMKSFYVRLHPASTHLHPFDHPTSSSSKGFCGSQKDWCNLYKYGWSMQPHICTPYRLWLNKVGFRYCKQYCCWARPSNCKASHQVTQGFPLL